MAAQTFESLLEAIGEANRWIQDILENLGETRRHRGYSILRSTLQSICDYLTFKDAMDLANHLPPIIRGFTLDGWRPTEGPVNEGEPEDFLARLAERMIEVQGLDPERAARAVFRLLSRLIDEGKFPDVRTLWRHPLKVFWPGAAFPLSSQASLTDPEREARVARIKVEIQTAPAMAGREGAPEEELLEIGLERSRIEQPTRSPATRERKSAMGLDAFDTSLQKVNEWLKELAKELKWTDREKAFFALQAVLGTLRDRLATSEAFKVSAQLPMILRGFYFEGWDTNQVPSRERTREDFLKRVAEKLPKDLKASAADATRAVFALLSHRMTRGEVVHVRTQLPQKVRKLWPEEEPLLPVESPRKARRASTGRGVQTRVTAPRSRARKARQEIRSAIARARAAGVTNQDLPVLISRKNLPSEASRRNRPHA